MGDWKGGRRRARAAVAAAVLLALPTVSSAAVYTWSGADPSYGILSQLDNWTTTATVAPPNDKTADLIFGSANPHGYNPTLNGNLDVHSLSFNASNYAYTIFTNGFGYSGILTLEATGLTDSATAAETITGSSAVALDANQPWNVAGAAFTDSTPLNFSTSVLTLNTTVAAGSATLSGVLSGTGAAGLTKTGAGKLNLTLPTSNASSISVMTLQGGTTQLSSGTLGLTTSSAYALTVNGGAVFNISGGGVVNTSAGAAVSALIDSGASVLVTGANSKLTAPATNGNIYVGLSGAATLTVSSGGSVSSSIDYIGRVSGTSQLVINSGSTVSAQDVYFGSTTGSIGTGTITGAGSSLTATALLSVGGGSNGVGTVSIANGGVVTTASTSFITSASSINISQGSLTTGSISDSGGATGSIALTDPSSGYALNINGLSGTNTYAGSISGGGTLNKSGGSTQILSGNNSNFTGSLLANGGTLALNSSNGFTHLNIASGATCTLNTTIAASGAVNNSGTLNVASSTTFSTNGYLFTQNAGTLNISGAMTADQFTLNGGTINGQVQLNSSTSNTLTLGTGGTGNFLINGTGAPTLNAYSGIPTNVQVTIQPSSGSEYVNVGSSPLTNNGTLSLVSANSSFVSLQSSVTNYGTFNISAGGAQLFGSPNVISGPLTNSGTMTVLASSEADNNVTNSGTINIGAGQTFNLPFAGETFNQTGGTLTIAGTVTTPSFNFTGGNVFGQVQLNSSSSNTLTLGSSLGSGSGSFLFNGTGAIAINGSGGSPTIPSAVTVTLQPPSGSVNVTGNGQITNNGTLQIVSPGNGSVVISQDVINTNVLTFSAASSLNSSAAIAGLTNENNGVVTINTTVGFGGATNGATFNIAAGQICSGLGTGVVFAQAAGTLNISGTLSTPYFNYSGGIVNLSNGSLNVANVLKVQSNTLSFTGGSITTAILDLSGSPSGFNFTGGSLTLTGAPVYVDSLTSAGTSSVGSALTITSGMSLTILNGNNELLGATGTGSIVQTGGTHTASTLNIGVFNTGSGSYNLSGSGTLTASIENVGLVGTGVFTQSGGTNNVGSLTLGDQPGHTDTYTLSSGALVATVGTYIGQTGNSVFNQSGGTHTTPEIGIGTAVGAIGTLNLTAGTTTVTGGLAVGGTPEAPGGAGTLNVSGSAVLTIAGGLTVYDSPTNALTVSSGGSLTANSVTLMGGATTLSGTGVFNVGSGGLIFAGIDSPSLTTASDTLLLNGDVTFNGSEGTASILTTGTGKVDLGGTGRTFNISQSSATVSMSIASPLTDGSLIKTGAGTLLLKATNTYTGSTTISAGTLEPAFPQALNSTSGVIVNSSATLDLNGQVIGNIPLTLNGTGVAAAGALINSSSTPASYSGTITLASDSSIGGSGAITTLGPITGSGRLIIAGPNTVTLSGGGNFSGGITVAAGLLLINQPISYTGGLTLTGGLAAITADYDLGDPSNGINLSTGGTLEISTNSFSTSRTITAAGGTLSVDSGQTFTCSGSVTGSGAINLAGAGTTRVVSSSNLSGAITISAGTLSLSGPAGALPNVSSISVLTTGTLELNSSTALGGNQLSTMQSRVNDAAAINLAGGTLSLLGSNSGTTTETLGALSLQPGASTISVVDGTSSASAYLTFTSLVPHVAGATLAFDAPLPGGNTRLLFTSGATSGQKMGGWVTVNGADFAKYDQTLGVKPFASSDYIFNTFTPNSDVEWTNATGSVPNVTISTLNLNTSGGNIALAQNGNTLTLSNSGLLQQGNSTTTFGGGTLTSSSGELDVSVNGTGTLNLNSTLSGSFVLTERGTGTLNLGGNANNNYSGFTLASGNLNLDSSATAIYGTLIVDGGLVTSMASNQLNTGASVILNSGTWNLNGKTETISSFTNNNGTMLFNGGLLTVTGTTTLSGGTTTLHSTLNTPILVINGGTNQVQPTAVSQVSVLLNFNGSSPSLQLSSNASSPGMVQLSAGTALSPVNLTFTGTGTATLSSIGTAAMPGVLDLSGTAYHDVIVSPGSTLAVSAAIPDGGFELHGGGTLQLSGANNYSGGTTISTATTLMAVNTAASSTPLGASGSTVTFNGGSLALRSDASTATFPYVGAVSGSGISTAIDIDQVTPVAGTSAGTFTINTMMLGSGNAGFSVTGKDGGTLVIGGTTGQGASILYNTATPGPAIFHTTANLTIYGALTASGGAIDIAKDGTGTMTLSGGGNNTIGNVTINAGTLMLSKTGGAIAVPGNLNINGNSTVTFTQASQIAPTATVTLNAATGPSLLNLNGFNNSFGSMGTGGLAFIAGGTLSTGTGTATLGSDVSSTLGMTSAAVATIQGNLNLGSSVRTFTVDRGIGPVDMSISAAISGNVGIIKAGMGILYLSGASTFSGPIQITGGVLEVASAASLGNSSNAVTLNGGTIEFGSAFDPSEGGTISLPASSKLDTQGNIVPIAGTISGSGALTKLGTGTLLLSGNNTFTGGLAIDAGTVQASADSELGAAGMPITFAGGTLALTTSVTTSRQLIVSSGGGSINASTGGTITLSTAPSWNANLTLTAGTLSFNATSGSATVTGLPTLTIAPLATVIDGGTVDPLHAIGGASVNIVNNSVTSFDVTTGAKAAGVISGIGNTNVSSGASLTATAIRQNRLNMNGGVTIGSQSPHNASAGVSDVSILGIPGSTNAWGSLLNLNNNDLVVSGENLATISNQVIEGYNNSKWNGSAGIASTAAANDTTHLTALGVIQNNQTGSALYGNGTTLGDFDGINVGPTDVLVKYTYYGDTNLDGRVDGSDYNLIDNGFHNRLTGWVNGDFNYDGVVDGSDYTLMDNAFNTQSGHLSAQVASVSASIAGSPSAVPEPAALGLLFIGGSALLSRRRR